MKLSQPSCALQPPSRVINYAVKVYKRTMGTRTYSSRVGKIVSLPPCEASTRFVGCCCCCSLSTVTSLSTSRKSGILILLQQIDFCLPVWRASHGHDFFHSGQCIFFFFPSILLFISNNDMKSKKPYFVEGGALNADAQNVLITQSFRLCPRVGRPPPLPMKTAVITHAHTQLI